jgi:RNA-binding protein YlmH
MSEVPKGTAIHVDSFVYGKADFNGGSVDARRQERLPISPELLPETLTDAYLRVFEVSAGATLLPVTLLA